MRIRGVESRRAAWESAFAVFLQLLEMAAPAAVDFLKRDGITGRVTAPTHDATGWQTAMQFELLNNRLTI